MITNYATITQCGMRNSFVGLVLPSVTSVFYIYLLKENFEQVPDELYRAAKVDGTSDLKYLWKVMLPICRPTLVTVGILKVSPAAAPVRQTNAIAQDSIFFQNGLILLPLPAIRPP